ncbi:protein sidekick-2-like, partial [Pocillopora damicornis]|uniref:protein sidekick-2-like n=1 Tax=Pocillopora damicornis TaxID=46731 RepID=UPI000F552EFE
MTVYRNGKAVDDLLQNTCEARNYPEITNFDFTIGSHTLPKASFDDIIVWLKLLSTSEVEELFSYYEGRANLHVNVSLELTDEEFNLEYRNITSEIFKHTSTWIESQVMSLHQNNSLLSVDNFVFWNVTNVAANFTIRFKGTEYREIEPLQTSLVSQSMLGNRPIRLLSKLTANDIYIHSLHVTAQNKSSTSLAVSWNYPEQLIHGIFCAVDISYRVINSVERQIVGVTSGSTEFEVKNLKPYTLYAITVTPFTHEGKGKESDEAIARTSEGVPTSPPLNVKVFVNKSTEKLEVSWEPLPSEHRLGIILGYKITYVPQSGGNSRGMVVNTSSLSTELQNLPKGIPYVI